MLLKKKDIKDLFIYINQLHPDCPTEKRPKLTDAVAETWIDALSGHSVDQLLKAARDHAAACRYWPSLAEILKQLPPVPESEKRRYAPPGPCEMKSLEESLKWQKQWNQELKERGLPTLREAVAAGMSVAEWRSVLDGAGVWA